MNHTVMDNTMECMTGRAERTAGGKRTMREKIFMALSIASFCSLFLPWFSFDVAVTGCQWGFYFLPLFAVPFMFIGICQFILTDKNPLYAALMEVSLISVPVLLVYKMATWHVMFITGEASLQTGLYTALPTFWVAMGLAVAAFLAYQPCLLRKKKNDSLTAL